MKYYLKVIIILNLILINIFNYFNLILNRFGDIAINHFFL